MFSILNPPPSSLPTPSPWVVPVHQPQASSIVHQTWTGNSFHTWYYTCFNAILPNLIVEVYVPDIRIGFFGCKLIYLYKVVPIDIFFKLKYVFACFFGLACSVNINSCIQFDAWYRMLPTKFWFLHSARVKGGSSSISLSVGSLGCVPHSRVLWSTFPAQPSFCPGFPCTEHLLLSAICAR